MKFVTGRKGRDPQTRFRAARISHGVTETRIWDLSGETTDYRLGHEASFIIGTHEFRDLRNREKCKNSRKL